MLDCNIKSRFPTCRFVNPSVLIVFHVRLEPHIVNNIRHILSRQHSRLQFNARLLLSQIHAYPQHTAPFRDTLLDALHTALASHAIDVNAYRRCGSVCCTRIGRRIRTLEAHVIDVRSNRPDIGQRRIVVHVADILGQNDAYFAYAQLGADGRLDVLHARLARHADDGQPHGGQRLVQQAVGFADIVELESGGRMRKILSI